MRRELVLVALLSGCESEQPAPPPVVVKKHVTVDGSNIARADYIGPTACGACHADEFTRWTLSLHRVMNAKIDDPSAVIGKFDTTLKYAGGEARFTHDATGYAMTLAKAGRVTRYRVTRTIGHRGLQEYVGVEAGHSDEVRLPFGWWPRGGGWFPQPYFDPWIQDEAKFDAYAPVREPWAERCPWCHSTYPFEQRIARSASPSQLGHGMEQMFTAIGGSDRLNVEQQVTVGISCESCHLGGRDHAAGGPIHFVPRGAMPREHAQIPVKPFAEERKDAEIVNAVCVQCHSGPSPRRQDQSASRNSSEAIDLAASPCTGIKCTDCHDPHKADSRGDDARSIAACTHCHSSLADASAAKAHAGRGHEQVNCLECHMPKVVLGIDRFVRTHTINSPNGKTLAVNACNLCHLDRSITWIGDELARGWDEHVDVSGWVRQAGDTPLPEYFLGAGNPDTRLVMAFAYARSPLGKTVVPKLWDSLLDPRPYVRAWTKFAIEEILGHPIAFDPMGDERSFQVGALMSRYR